MILESGQEIDGYGIGLPLGIYISNTGQIAFGSFLEDFELDQDKAIVTPDRIVIKPGDVIGGQRVFKIDGFNVNDNGDIVADWRSGGIDDVASFLSTETEILVRTGDVVDGLTIHSVGDPRLNNAGQLAFFASVTNEAGDDRQLVLFAHDEIIAAEGELFDGKVIRRLEQIDMNDRGDVAFRVQFEDLSQVIIMATHSQIPEPDTLVLAAMGLIGLFMARRRSPRAARQRIPSRGAMAILIQCQGDPS